MVLHRSFAVLPCWDRKRKKDYRCMILVWVPDRCCLAAKNYSAEPDYIKYYGQELMPSTYNLARMNIVSAWCSAGESAP
jgi:hypothetical protein